MPPRDGRLQTARLQLSLQSVSIRAVVPRCKGADDLDSERIAELIREAVAKSDPIVIPELPGLPRIIYHGRQTDPGAKAALVSKISGESELNIFDQHSQMIVMPLGGASGSTVSFEMLAEWLIWRGSEVGPDQVVDELQRYVENPDFPCTDILAIAGLETTFQIDVGDNIKLLPFSEVPDSLWKAGLEKIPAPLPLQNLVIARSALTQDYRSPKYHRSLEPDDQTPMPTLPDMPNLVDVCYLITLAGPGAPVPIARWQAPALSVPCTNMGAGGAQPLLEGVVGPVTKVESEEDIDRIHRLYASFSQFGDNEKSALRIPLSRLNSALRRQLRPVDAVIDLGIAMESLFLTDEERTELGFRLRLRASRILESDLDSRRDLSRFLSEFYRARSHAVHSGRLPHNLDGIAASIMIERATEVVRRALDHIISNGRPDWDEVQFGQ